MQKNLEVNAASDAVSLNCSAISRTQGKGKTNCSSFSWGLAYSNGSLGNCSAETYIGGVCRPQLLEWQECAVRGSEGVFLDLTFMKQTQLERERDVAQFLHFLSESP